MWARRRARAWLVTINLTGIALSRPGSPWGAAVSSAWVPEVLVYSLIGLAAGCVLGAIGIARRRWKVTPQASYYLPNVLLAIALREVANSEVARTWRNLGRLITVYG
jgi:hypothetical protein